MNSDIVLDYRHTGRLQYISPNAFFALSRYEFLSSSKNIHTMENIWNARTELFGHDKLLSSQFYYTQDAWVIYKYPSASGIFTEKLGVPNCDGRIAYHFNQLGYNVYNPCLAVYTYHFHDNKDRSYYLPSCPGNLLYVRPTSLGAMLEPNIKQGIVVVDINPVNGLTQKKNPRLSFIGK